MVNNHYRWDFIGLSTDEKPTPETSEKVANGSTFYCSDTSKLYVWYKNQWYEKVVEGGGSSYTAGNGIDINDNEISVDTDTIQPKLTAGTGIDITDNTISATGGGGPTVVQTTGNSTTDVMSQDATTKMIFNTSQPSSATSYPTTQVCIGRNSTSYTSSGIAIGDTSNIGGSGYTDAIAIGHLAGAEKYGVSVGGRAKALGDGTTSIGYYAGYNTRDTNNHNTFLGYYASATDSSIKYSVALGSASQTSRNGEVNVGTGSNTNGYNNTSYRVIGGVHDGQEAHDAVTVEQVNATIDAINTALSISIPHIGAQEDK